MQGVTFCLFVALADRRGYEKQKTCFPEYPVGPSESVTALLIHGALIIQSMSTDDMWTGRVQARKYLSTFKLIYVCTNTAQKNHKNGRTLRLQPLMEHALEPEASGDRPAQYKRS